MKIIRVFFFVQTVFLLAIVSPLTICGKEKDIFEDLNRRRDQVIEEITKSIACQSTPNSNLYCHAKFRGLEVEFAEVTNSKPGGTLYVHSLGANQTVSPFGNNCLEVKFADNDLKQGIFPVQVILRNDGKVFSIDQLARDYKGCR